MRLKPDLSHDEKEDVVLEYARNNGLKIMVETGVFEGKMISGTNSFFESIHSVELVKEYYDNAVAKFKDLSNVILYHGNSPTVLSDIIPLKEERCLVWLDAHDGKNSPAMEELEVIFNISEQEHVILIDDMRNFDIRRGYPNIQEIIDFTKKRRPLWSVEIKDDIMRMFKRNA